MISLRDKALAEFPKGMGTNPGGFRSLGSVFVGFFALFGGTGFWSARRAKENSPPIHRWAIFGCACGTRRPVRSRTPFFFGWLLLLLPILSGFSQNSPTAPVHFQAVDIYVDSKEASLAAYQFEFRETNGVAKIVGIEGGDHPAFKEAPYYDPKAMQQERVIVAAFNTSGNLPKGKTRVATIHVQLNGDQQPGFSIKLAVAADATGNKISAEATFEERKKP